MVDNVEVGDQTPPVEGRTGVGASVKQWLRNRFGSAPERSPLERRLSPKDFPTPRMALRNHLTLADVEWFGPEQAKAANLAASNLDAELTLTPEYQWPEVFKDLYSRLESWRYELAVKHGTDSSGAAAPKDAQRFLDHIMDGPPHYPNVDPIGADVGFWHNGYEWDESLGRHAGGKETPASRVVAEAGEWADARLDQEGNSEGFLQNHVRLKLPLPDGSYFELPLPDGRDYVDGNSLSRGESARKHKKRGLERAGVVTDRTEINGNIIYAETATEANRATIREALYGYLSQIEAAHQRGETITVQQWAEAAYLLYQSPQNKKGSDAVSRVYLMALARRWLRPIPKLPDAVDWLAYTVGQNPFVEEVVRLNSVS